MKYLNLDIEASNYIQVGDRETFEVRIVDSPAGQQTRSETVLLSSNVHSLSRKLETRNLELGEMINLGEELAAALFPPTAKSFFEQSRARLTEAQGLRIRLKLASFRLASLPWEYTYIRPPDVLDGQKGRFGFLALDSRISLTRYEVFGAPPGDLTPAQGRTLRIVALLASPEGLPPLDLKTEQKNIREALGGSSGVDLEFGSASVQALQDLLARGADVFHFAGHGGFAQLQRDEEGYLAFVGPDGSEAPLTAEILALNLAWRGVRLAFLGACEAGRRNGHNAWSGIAPALTRAGIPAVLGMQYTIQDGSAIAFSNQFYRDLFLGLPIDEAVRNGRLAILNRPVPDKGDWGVPVLYLRAAADGILFPRESTQQISKGLDGLEKLMRNRQEILLGAQQFKFVFDRARRQSAEVVAYKEIHDQLDDLQTLCYERIADEASRFLDDPNAQRRLAGYQRQLQKIIFRLNDITKDITRDSSSHEVHEWSDYLERIRQVLNNALLTVNEKELHQVKDDLRDILETQPTAVNRRLLDAAFDLNLPELLAALQSLLDRVDTTTDAGQWQQIKTGVDALGQLSGKLSVLLEEHNQWQEIDRRFRLIESDIAVDADGLEANWRKLTTRVDKLCCDRGRWATDIGSHGDWSSELLADVTAVQTTILARDITKTRYNFRAIRDKAGDRFLRVDKALKRLCSEELRPAGERLYGILTVMK